MYPTKKLGDICKFQNGFAFKSELFKERGLPIIRISNIQDNDISYKKLVYFDASSYECDLSKYIVSKGDLVIAMSGATTGKLAINNNDEDFYLNQRVGKFVFKDEITKFYIHYLLSTKIQDNLDQSVGSAIPNLSTEQIKNISIPLPPLPIQQKIVSKLDASFANLNIQIDLLKQNISNTEELNKSVLEKVFSGDVLDIIKKISDIAEIKSGKRLLKGDRVLDEKTNFPYIRVSDFGDNGTIDSSKLKYISEGVFKGISNYIITSNDLYISIAGTIGKTGIIPKELNGANLTENAIRLVYKDKNEIYNQYIYYFTISDNFKKQAGLATRAVAMPKLAISRLKEIQIPIPSLYTQKEIVSYLDQVFEKNKALRQGFERQIKVLEELKQSLLKDAFEGRLVQD